MEKIRITRKRALQNALFIVYPEGGYMEQKVLRVGTLVIACALVLKLFGAGMLDSAQKFSLPQELASWMIFLLYTIR